MAAARRMSAAPLVLLPGGAGNEQRGGVDGGGHVGELFLRMGWSARRSVAELARGEAKVTASSSARRAKPSAAAPTVTRNRSSASWRCGTPGPGPPISSACMHFFEFQPARGCGAMTSIRSATVRPGSSPRTMKAEMPGHPRLRRCGRNINTSAMVPLQDVAFLAVEQPVAALRAVMAMLAASEPVSGSVKAKAAMASPLATLGSHSSFCASAEQADRTEPRPCMAKAKWASPDW